MHDYMYLPAACLFYSVLSVLFCPTETIRGIMMHAVYSPQALRELLTQTEESTQTLP